jgi:hypothetical protein
MKRTWSAIALVTLVASSAALSTAATAQEPVRLPTRLIPRVSVAGGLDARNDGSGDPEMYFGLATLEWGTGVSGLSFRVDGVYANRDRINPVEAPCITCGRVGTDNAFLSSKVTGAGALVGATYELRHGRAFRPYILGGAGMILTHDKSTSGKFRYPTCGVETCNMVAAIAGPVTQRNDRPTKAAAQLGAGLVYSWQWVSVLAEARYLAVDYANPRGLNGAVPISLGVRF